MEATHMPPVEKQFCDASGCKKAPSNGAFRNGKRSAYFGDVRSLRSLLSLHHFELDLIALGERFETGSADRAEMDENVRTAFTRNEAKSLGVVEPFDRTSDACH